VYVVLDVGVASVLEIIDDGFFRLVRAVLVAADLV
jgi:hypothetical protein